jgi:hypothetical protein
VSRNSSNETHADQKLDAELEKECQTGQPFDEVWFFGFHQSNKKRVSFGMFRGGPESELTENEVSVLRLWMEAGGNNKSVGGGVLLTGDHNHPRPADATPGTNPLCPDNPVPQAFLGRGRALGRCVPRAGQLRTWECEPTNRAEDSHNTIESSGIQTDRIPQQLIHRNVDAAGNLDPNGQPHPIFRYKPGSWISFFPDHNHEGEVIVPTDFDPELWRGQVRPHVVARGIDRRHATLVDLVVAYNGDLANVGRIVADSSWHHYFNINLRQFAHPAPDGSAADQIGQFYANLAVWLSPRHKRYEMTLAMLWRLANYTALMEQLDDVVSIGREAHAILSQAASPCEIYEMFQAVIPARYGILSFPEGGLVLSHLPSQELLLGCILASYHDEMIRAESTGDSYKPREVDEVINLGVERAFKEQAALLGLMAWETLKLISPASA